MEDLADALKRQYLGLYKKKSDIFGSVQQRVDKMNEQRKANRRQEAFEKRKIPNNMSPIVTPLPKRAKKPQKKAEEPKAQKPEPAPNSRMEQFLKWKIEKEQRLAAVKKQAKPLFKVCHIPVSVGLPNLENVNKEIKGKAFKSTFAPDNHKFKPPANIKPIAFAKPESTSRNEPKKTDKTSVKHGMVTRSQNSSTSGAKKPQINSTKRAPKAKAEKKDAKGVKSKSQTEIKVKQAHTRDLSLSPDFPVEVKNLSESEDVKTPNKTQPPVYVSPFVTMSRGKDSARKEYEARRSRRSSFSAKKGAVDCTSPKAGAAYFRWRLKTEISRLQDVCDQWNKYKDEERPPEEAVSMIDCAVGQTNLLLTKKFVQFEGLIDQCDDDSGSTSVRCEDLHGFWDMIYIQVENLDRRFENLTKLKANAWQEIIPERAKPAVQKKTKSVKNAKASSGLKAAIEAARRKRDEEKRTPRNRRSSNRLDLVKSHEKGRQSGSPGLMMMKVAQYAKSVETPGKSILKSEVRKSAKSQSKTVLFRDEVDTENDLNTLNVQTAGKTPRRSTRLSKSKLF